MSFMLLTASDVTVLAPTGTCLLRGQVPVVLTAGRQSARPARLARGTPPRTSQTSAPAEYPDVLRLLHPMQYGPFLAAAAGRTAAFADVAAACWAHLRAAGEAEWRVGRPALLRLDELGGAVRSDRKS